MQMFVRIAVDGWGNVVGVQPGGEEDMISKCWKSCWFEICRPEETFCSVKIEKFENPNRDFPNRAVGGLASDFQAHPNVSIVRKL